MTDTGGQSKRSPRKKSPSKQTEAEQVSGFLRSIGYRKKDDDSSYGNALEVLKTIFEATGQQNLLELVKLRRLWFGEIGDFLAKKSPISPNQSLRSLTSSSRFCCPVASKIVLSTSRALP